MPDLKLEDYQEMLSPIQKEIFDTIRANKGISRPEIIQKFAKPNATISDQLSKLLELNLIQKKNAPRDKTTQGRPIVQFTLTKSAKQLLEM